MPDVPSSLCQTEPLFPNSFSFRGGCGWICCLRDANNAGPVPSAVSPPVLMLSKTSPQPQRVPSSLPGAMPGLG